MFLTVGEISKALGMSSEAIRYYVKEGLITPTRNAENNYWEYSSDDLMRLTDILFYRSMDLTLRDIKQIMDGIELEKIGDVISTRKAELINQIKQRVDSLYQLQDWEEKYKRELKLIGHFEIGEMPAEFRRYGCFEEPNHIAKYLEECFMFEKDDWGGVSLSFYYNINEKDGKPQHYLSVEESQKLNPMNTMGNAIEEKAENCIFTEVHYSDNVMDMVSPIIEYAIKEKITLLGEFYGREDTNYFKGGKRLGLYKVYAPINK